MADIICLHAGKLNNSAVKVLLMQGAYPELHNLVQRFMVLFLPHSQYHSQVNKYLIARITTYFSSRLIEVHKVIIWTDELNAPIISKGINK